MIRDLTPVLAGAAFAFLVGSCAVTAQQPAPLGPIFTIGSEAVCFTPGNNSVPGSDCAALAVSVIGQAKASLDIQAYNFTEPRIGAAIVAAKARGAAVRLIVDKISAHQRGEQVDLCAAAGIPVFVDRRPRIAHNKVMIIDGKTVITGSFNFSVSAQKYNAENMLVISDPDLAADYEADFERRLSVSVPYAPAPAAPESEGGE